MGRRRLRINCSDSEEEEPNQQQQENSAQNTQHSTVANPPVIPSPPNPNPNPNPNPDHSDPSPIPDDDDFFTPPEPTVTTDSPIEDYLLRLGLRLRREWLNSCVQGLESSVEGFSGLDVSAKAKLCFQQFLFSDMNYSGAGVLPENVDSMHMVDLKGPFVLQVDEILNISCPLRGRYHGAPSGIKRCLKLSMTDGVQRVFGMEYRSIKDLNVLAPAGLKVVVCNVHVRRGLLMLVPEALEVLGGMVQELDAARQRLVDEVNKPARGKRTRTGVVPSLATRATLAAWPSNDVHVTGNTDSSTSQNATPFQANEQGGTFVGSTTNTSQRAREEFTVPVGATLVGSSTNTSQRAREEYTVPVGANLVGSRTNTSQRAREEFTVPAGATLVGSTTNTSQRAREEFAVPTNGTVPVGATLVGSRTNTSQRAREEFAVPINGESAADNPPSNVVADFEEMHIDTHPISRENAVPSSNFDAVLDVDDINMVDDVEHPLILSGDREVPFTYLASLSAKWAALKGKSPSVQGKIKCFLTGVKRFQYKGRETYELLVYVDDGSLISEILIDHKAVQKGIGHSPEEVMAALSSPDKKKVSGMKEIFKHFQLFLVNFEGTMLVEINEASPHLIALEMTEGCPVSDAWLLLRRLKSSTSAHASTPPHQPMDPIDISP